MSKVRGILIDTVRNTVSDCTADGSLNDYYRLINCSCIDIVDRRIGGKRHCIICDDEGLLKEETVVSAINDTDLRPMLVGNLFIANVDADGNTVSLTNEEIEKIMQYIKPVFYERSNGLSHVLLCGY